ncbi:hypothetical protein GGI20_001396 [Coemansia sp. BCRC 34301]|nr:hypothetical protein GGI20_001396 [Coemansia sp. BCRC 34301]
MAQKSQTNTALPLSGASQKTPIPIDMSGTQQRVPIPIKMPSGQLFGSSSTKTGKEPESRFSPGSVDPAGSHSNSHDIRAPPNSLVTPSSLLGQGSFAAAGGLNAPPNTPAQPSKLHQMMAGAGLGSGAVKGYSNVPTSSFVEKMSRGMANVSEADENEPVDQDADMDIDEFSPDFSNQSSFRQDSRPMSSDESEPIFRMEQ